MAPSKDLEKRSIELCKLCKLKEAEVDGRNERLCRDCFLHYVRSKVIKRMEGFRVRHSKSSTSGTSPRKLLLPITFGASSLALLHILSEHLKSQKERVKKTGYQLLVVYVDESVIKKNTPALERLDEVKGRIVAAEGREEITFLTVPLEDIYSFKNAAEEAIESEVEENTSNRMMIRDGPNIDDKSRLQSLLSALASRTSQADILNILRTRLLVEVAKREGCEGVLWDDSTTRLAEKILSETAKGRGFSVPWQVADGPSPYGITFNYPNRDILKKELHTFASLSGFGSLCNPNSNENKQHTPVNAKSTTIDDLMSQYFGNLEDSFPGIVANVVRTASKLTVPKVSGARGACTICGLPKDEGGDDLDLTMGQLLLRDDRHRNENAAGGAASTLCSGCARSTMEAGSYQWPL